jgi:pyruvate formate lyase activating enzyme
MKLLGLQKLTLLDFPGRVAAILFLGGCNFRCPFCQNSSLVCPEKQPPELTSEELRSFLKKRAGLLEGICVSGGEPTLSPDLPELLDLIRSYGYQIKLDTNGSRPDVLEHLLNRGLLDYVAMDIKAGRANYTRVCGCAHGHGPASDSAQSESTAGYNAGTGNRMTQVEHLAEHDAYPIASQVEHSIELDAYSITSQVEHSARLLRESTIPYEFRTTVVRPLHTDADFLDIGTWLADCIPPVAGGSDASDRSADSGSRFHYYLQSFRDCPEVLEKNHSFSAFSHEEMLHFLQILQKKIPQACLRDS